MNKTAVEQFQGTELHTKGWFPGSGIAHVEQ